MLDVFIAEVMWPGNVREGGEYGAQVSATLKPLGGSDEDKFYINGKPDTASGNAILAKTSEKGKSVAVVKMPGYGKTESGKPRKDKYYLAKFDQNIMSKLRGGAAPQASASGPARSSNQTKADRLAAEMGECFDSVCAALDVEKMIQETDMTTHEAYDVASRMAISVFIQAH